MAIYHLTASVVSRARGHRIVAFAAAQSAGKLYDEYYGIAHDGTRKSGVEHTEIRAPASAPPWVYDRGLLWNRVEAAERRKDAQLARAVEISLPAELSPSQDAALLREFVDAEFVSRGMIADLAIRRARPDRPNAHVLLTLREPCGSGFGPKVRLWNRKANLLSWRQAWAQRANVHLARAGHRVRIDHRSLEEQQVELIPARNTGVATAAHGGKALPQYMHDRLAEQQQIARDNGDAILQDPSLAIRALTRQRSVFTREDLIRFLTSRTADAAQLEAALTSVLGCTELAPAPRTLEDAALFTSRDLIEAEKSLQRRAQTLASRRGHAGAEGDFKAVAVTAEAMGEFVAALRSHWDARGYRVRTALPAHGDLLAKNDVVIIQDAEMIDLKALERLLAVVERARAKLVLIGDSAQLAAMGAISPLRDLMEPG